MMRTGIYLGFLILLSGFVQDPPQPDKVPPTKEQLQEEHDRRRRAAQIEEGVLWLLDQDPELSSLGRKRLLRFGQLAAPALEAELAKRDATKVFEVLRRILLAEAQGESRWVDDQELDLIHEQLKRKGHKLRRGAADRYVYAKFAEAHAIAKMGNTERGYRIAVGLLTLEPKSRYAKQLKTFRRYCEQRITQSTILQAGVFVDRDRVTIGDKIAFRLRLVNVSSEEITLTYGSRNGKPAGRVLIPVRATIYDPTGSRTTVSAHLETDIDAEIPIATGAQWETVAELDTGAVFPESDFFRVFEISAWTLPSRMESASFRTVRKITFEPARVKVVPKMYRSLLKNPLNSLGEMIDTGNLNEVFCAAMLLGEEQRAMGMEMLVTAMESAGHALGRAVVANILYQMTDQKHGADPKAWRAWVEGRKPGKK